MIPKFRAWSPRFEKMYEVTLIDYVNGDIGLKTKNGGVSISDLDSLVPMQSTGLKDKNGKEIFEGDVVTFEDCDDVDTDFVYVNRGVIEYAAPTFHITNRNSTEMEDLLDGNTLDVIVLGSIYEHPHLMEVK